MTLQTIQVSNVTVKIELSESSKGEIELEKISDEILKLGDEILAFKDGKELLYSPENSDLDLFLQIKRRDFEMAICVTKLSGNFIAEP